MESEVRQRTEQENTALFLENEKLIGKVYSRWFSWFKGYKEDLMACGRLGLWQACINYDETLGTKFSAFACSCIKNAMANEARKEMKYEAHRTGYDILTPDGEIHDITELTDNGQYEEMLQEADLDIMLRDIRHKEDFKQYLKGDTIINIAKSQDVSKQLISARFINEKEKIIDKIH